MFFFCLGGGGAWSVEGLGRLKKKPQPPLKEKKKDEKNPHETHQSIPSSAKERLKATRCASTAASIATPSHSMRRAEGCSGEEEAGAGGGSDDDDDARARRARGGGRDAAGRDLRGRVSAGRGARLPLGATP